MTKEELVETIKELQGKAQTLFNAHHQTLGMIEVYKEWVRDIEAKELTDSENNPTDAARSLTD